MNVLGALAAPVRAVFCRWICRNGSTHELIDSLGLRIRGALVTGQLDLSFVDVPFPLVLEQCVVPAPVRILNANIPWIGLSNSRLQGVLGAGVQIAGRLDLRGTRIEGTVDLSGARIGGDVDLTQAVFQVPQALSPPVTREYAVDGDGMNVSGDVVLTSTIVAHGAGEVRLQDSNVGGQLYCGGAKLRNENQVALRLDGAHVVGGVFLTNHENLRFHSQGTIRMLGTTVDKGLQCSGALMELPDREGAVLAADRVRINGNVELNNGYEGYGCVRFHRSEIEGQFLANAARIINSQRVAINLEGARISGQTVLADGLYVQGSVHLHDAVLDQHLSFRGASLSDSYSDYSGRIFTILAQGLRVNGNVLFDRSRVTGESFVTDGKVLLDRGDIAGSIDFADAFFAGYAATGATLSATSCDKQLFWTGVVSNGRTDLELRNFSAQEIIWDLQSRASLNRYVITGLDYQLLTNVPDTHAERLRWVGSEIQWINGQEGGRFFPQPYEHLERLLRQHGYVEESRKVGIEKRKALIRSGDLPRLSWLWNQLLRVSIGFGISYAVCNILGHRIHFDWNRTVSDRTLDRPHAPHRCVRHQY